MLSKGFLFVVSAPSGAGKSTLLAHLLEKIPELSYSISHTTRPKRNYEENGKHYFFVSIEEFQKMIEKDEFLEFQEVHGNFYGTSKVFIEKLLSEGKNIILDLDVFGSLKIKEKLPQNTVLVFITVPSLAVLEERIRKRSSETEETIKIRLERAKKELPFVANYDFVVENIELDETIRNLENIVNSYIKK
ncbi:guanylate kinase [bacterium]|nr:guanylate kinase [bacterium]